MPSYRRRRHPFPRPPPSPPRRAPPARTLPRTFYRPSVRYPPLAYMARPAPAGLRACARGYTHIPAARLIPNYPLDLTPTAPPAPGALPLAPPFPPPPPAPELPAANFD